MLENENMIDLFGSLKEMSSDRLSRLIQEETAKESPNDELVLMALDILEDREKEKPMELGPKGRAAWIKYQSKIRARDRKTVLNWKPMMQVASVLVAITLLFTLLPTKANAETWWERLARWTDDFFSFFSPNSYEKPEDEYVFQTDNEGLQQVYDAVVELGIVEPVVPMWLPEKYELVECNTILTPARSFVMSRFSDNSDDIVLQVNVYTSEVMNEYYKGETEVKIYEENGVTYSIMQNYDKWVVIWTKDNYECSIFIDCQEDTLEAILESIYRWGT